MTDTVLRPFDIADPLPIGTALLEASAGTGKTYALGSLVTRFVAEGIVTLPRLLAVTFGRAASQELRDRVRRQLVSAQAALADPALARSSDDAVHRVLAGVDDVEVRVRRRRLAAALADFDAATIATTHQFCQQVLAGLGVAGDSDPGATLVEDLDDIVVEVVEDLYLRGFSHAERTRFDLRTARLLGFAAVHDPQARLEPVDAEPGSDALWRYRFAAKVRQEVDRRKRSRGLLSYDDLLSQVAGALGPGDAAARTRMRERWSVVLVDEFQDTDPVQWEVLREAFDGHARMVLIGDPKQAIYAFRGGDVATYLAAARSATARATLARNWRSDASLVAALQKLTGAVELGDPEIVIRPVSAEQAPRLSGAPHQHPVRLRVLRRDQFSRRGTTMPRIAAVRDLVARDLAADIGELLAAQPSFDGRALGPGGVAVLVGTHAQAGLVKQALGQQGIPSVIAGAGSVFAAPAGREWLRLLEALEQPHRPDLVRTAALGPFFGYSVAELDSGGDRLSDDLAQTMASWARMLAERGVAAVLEVATAQNGLWQRHLMRADGERLLTDLRHVGQSLHAVAVSDGLSLSSLVEWLRRRRIEVTGERSEERARRLDSDADAVQIVTLHASKGLEYPVVYLPFAFDRWVRDDPGELLLHDDDGSRILDLGGPDGPEVATRRAKAASEDAGEALRLLYVGLTRAQSQVVLWWAPSANTASSGLHRVLFGRAAGTSRLPDRVDVPSDAEVDARLTELQAAGGLVVERAEPASVAPVPSAGDAEPDLAVRTFDRPVDLTWRRSSYSSLTAGTHHEQASVASEPEFSGRDDENVIQPTGFTESRDPDAADLASPMSDLPGGTTFGTLVHAVLETVDTSAADLRGELLSRCEENLERYPVPVDPQVLAAALERVLETPLGPLADQTTLRGVTPADRRSEMDFELPLTGGDAPHGAAVLADIGEVLRRHLPPGSPLGGYPDQLLDVDLASRELRGYLNGSIDAILRVPGDRFLVVDYKTNHLGQPGKPLSTKHYQAEALDRAMTASHYPLQALLYSVALHRFLRWRLPRYDPAVHLGGVLYLFVRGMCGPETPSVAGVPAGVFSWRPGAELVLELSELLDRGSR